MIIMKKILLILVAAFFTISANAQLSKCYETFKVGEYVFKPAVSYEWNINKSMGGGTYECYAEDIEEVNALADFILENKKALENKYGVTIMSIDHGFESHLIYVEVYNTKAYDKYQEARRRKMIAGEKKAAQEKQKREDSLNKIF